MQCASRILTKANMFVALETALLVQEVGLQNIDEEQMRSKSWKSVLGM